jgi:hypothetical protein
VMVVIVLGCSIGQKPRSHRMGRGWEQHIDSKKISIINRDGTRTGGVLHAKVSVSLGLPFMLAGDA